MIKACYVDLDIEIKNAKELLEFASSEVFKAGLVTSSKLFLEGLIAREKEITTAVGKGVAFPHAKGEFVKEGFVYFIRTKNQIDFKAVDKKGVNLFFIIGTPINNEKMHLKVLSKLANILSNAKEKELITTETNASKLRDYFVSVFKPNVLILGATYAIENRINEHYKDKINFKFVEKESDLDIFDTHINDFNFSLIKTDNEKFIACEDFAKLSDELEKLI